VVRKVFRWVDHGAGIWENASHRRRRILKANPQRRAYVIGTLFESGAGTTAAAMISFILAMVLHQDSLSDLQRDIDEVVGDRLPTFEDIPHLPRVRAIVKESLRWRPVTAGGVPTNLSKTTSTN
jgi:cytochrome P450